MMFKRTGQVTRTAAAPDKQFRNVVVIERISLVEFQTQLAERKP
jgi:hypothetical protein